MRYRTITFLSDYGYDDEFVGIVKSVVASIAPDVSVVDLAHNVAPYDIRAGGLLLARAAQYLVPGVVLAIVDPGVGSARRGVAVELAGGESVLVGPDNGLLAPATALCGGATRAVALTNADYHLEAPGLTFAGRDVFGPVAAHLCLGAPLTDLGELIDPHTLVPAMIGVARHEADALIAEVLWVDRYGNVQLNLEPDDIADFDERLRVVVQGRTRVGVRSESYATIGTGALGIVTDSYGLVSLAIERGSAAAELGLGAGDEVRLERVDETVQPAGAETTVRLIKKGTL